MDFHFPADMITEKDKPLPPVPRKGCDIARRAIVAPESHDSARNCGNDCNEDDQLLKDDRPALQSKQQYQSNQKHLSYNETYYSPHDWPLQSKARPWSPVFSQNHQPSKTPTLRSKVSSDTLGIKSLNGLRELYDPYQPSDGDMECLFYQRYEDFRIIQKKQSTLQKALSWLGLGNKNFRGEERLESGGLLGAKERQGDEESLDLEISGRGQRGWA